MPEEIRENQDKSVSVAQQKKRGVYSRILRANPRFLSEAGYHGVYLTASTVELHSTEEFVRMEMGRVVVPIFGDISPFIRGLNPSHTVRPRKDVRKPRRGRKSGKKGGKK